MEMRIACLSVDPGAPYGGRQSASVRVGELADALAAEGARVLALMPSVARDATQPGKGVTVETLPWPGSVASDSERLAAERERERWIEARLERFGAGALFERLAPRSAAGSRAAARLGIPHLVDFDSQLKAEAHPPRGLGEPDGAARLEREVLARAERVFAASGPLAKHALRCGASRVEVLPDAVAVERHPRRRRQDGRRPVAVFAGRVRPWHGIETVAAAWRLMGEAAPTLVVAGDAGEAAGMLEGVGAVLLGPIPHRQVPAVLAEADIGLAPYGCDAPDTLSPLKLYEYMGAGLATVAAELPATRDLAAGEQAVLVPPGDPEALAAVVAGLAVDSPRRDRIGKAARALVADAHTWRHRARRVIEHAAGRARPAPRPERSPLPTDPALPQMPQVLDTDVMAEVLAESLRDDAEPTDVRVSDLRYEPETSLLVHYDVGIGGTRHHATALIGDSEVAGRARTNEGQALADMVNGRSPAERALSFEPSLGALVQWLPLDLSLWALAVPPAHRDRRLRAAGVHTKRRGEEPTLLAYRPQSRAVVRLNGHVLKYYASHASYGQAVAGLEVGDAAPVRTPRFEGTIPELLLTVQSHVLGREVDSPAATAAQAGATLARLHAASHAALREWRPGEQLQSAAEAARLAGRIVPALRPRLEALVRRLEAAQPADLEAVAAHGDFHAGRLLGAAGELFITDFDAMCAAPAALDLATYTARVVRGEAGDLDAALAVMEVVVEGYGGRPEQLSWYLATAILRRSTEPFRRQDEQWPERIEGIVSAAEGAIA
ncbi:MAG TPA: glycosyltransferase [Thermoleophilaceae bacterium]|nr:glycosyltransferase [Thermoleophilaceae bacterium]